MYEIKLFPLLRLCICQSQARKPMDIFSTERHSSGCPLPLFLQMVDPGDLQSHLSAAAVPLPAPRSVQHHNYRTVRRQWAVINLTQLSLDSRLPL